MRLPANNIDLVSINCVNPSEGVAVIKHCQKYFNFGKSILLTHEKISVDTIDVNPIDKLTWDGYNNLILSLTDYSSNDYVMIVQDDGYIVNPDLWDDEYLNYDYIGAPWPTEDSWVKQQSNTVQKYVIKNRIGNGGFSLRSKKFLEFSKQFQSTEGFGEDFYLCCYKYDEAISYGIKFAPFDLAVKFSYENPCIEYSGTPWNHRIAFDKNKHFGWHGRQFSNYPELLRIKQQ